MYKKVRRTILALFVLIMLLVPFATACESGEAQQFIYWAKLWAIVHDITDADGNPNYGAITRFAVGEALGLGSTGDDEGDAAIDCARILNNIRQAEDAADEGWDYLYEGRNIRESVLPNFNKAIDLRPDDWSYYNGRAIAHAQDIFDAGGLLKAREDMDKADARAKKSGKPEEYIKMLRNREQGLARLVAQKNERHAIDLCGDIYAMQSRTYEELYKLTGDNDYLLLKQQADTNLGLGFYADRVKAISP
jgi:hypothetical protein